MKKKSHPLFLGISHIGQVFSIGWSEKFGKCSVFDFNKKQLANFSKGRVTQEETNLKKFFIKNKKKIHICKTPNEIKSYTRIFLTLDTPLKENGEPKVREIKNFLYKAIPFFSKNSNLIITSQVYCGFCDDIKNTILKKRKDINLIYMVDTLKMGIALSRFLKPEQIIFGTKNKIKCLSEFKKFNCQIFYFSYKQAEMIKMAINLYLASNVTFANALDNYCRDLGFNFSSIVDSLRLDKRIGKHSYILPSLGISGGHLERDISTIVKTSKNRNTKDFFLNMNKLHQKRLNVLKFKFFELQNKFKFDKIIWVGPSYKQESFSLLNSPFIKFYKSLKKIKKIFFVYDSFFNLKKLNNFKVLKKIKSNFKNKVLIILNYASKSDLMKINFLMRKDNYYLLDIGIIPSFIKSKNIRRTNLFG